MVYREKTILSGSDNFMTIRHLTIGGSDFEIGKRLGQLASERHAYVPSRYATDPTFARARRAYFQRNYPSYWERACGLAAAFGFDAQSENYDFTNLPYHLEVPFPVPACSVVYYPPSTTATDHGYLSRNYDFPTGTMADVMGIPLSAEARSRIRPVMSEPYIMEWHPEGRGYSSIAIHAFDLMGGTLDGMNSEGLVVSILADEQALFELGPRLEVNPGTARAIGLNELQLARLLLDTCATAEDAKEALLTVKQYYAYIPLHYMVADRNGNSFVYENSTGRNIQHIIDGEGRPQVVTNFQLHRYRTLDQVPAGPLTSETNSFWRYRKLADLLAGHHRPFDLDDIKHNNACVNMGEVFAKMSPSDSVPIISPGFPFRTLWHSIYDQQARTMEISFYLRDRTDTEEGGEVRSKYLKFTLN